MTALLKELISIANSAAIAVNRELRARPLLSEHGVAPPDVAEALLSNNLNWNAEMAHACGISAEQWRVALRVSGLEEVDSLGELLEVLRRAESAARMIRAGYQPDKADGHLVWIRPQATL
jgi:hypothetical protein